MKRHRSSLLVITAGIILAFSGCGQKAQNDPAPIEKTAVTTGEEVQAASQHRDWYTMPDGLKLAEAGKKPIIIDFYTDWCKWCKTMDEKTFSDPEVAQYLFENFIPIRINAESEETVVFKGKEYTYSEITQAFRVTGFPSLAYLTPAQDLITVIPGYIEKPEFMKILKYIKRECYLKQVPFDQFDENSDCLEDESGAK